MATVKHTTLTANSANNVNIGTMTHKSVFVWYHAIRGALSETGRILIQNKTVHPEPMVGKDFDDCGLWDTAPAASLDGSDLVLTITVDNSSVTDTTFSYYTKPIKS